MDADVKFKVSATWESEVPAVKLPGLIKDLQALEANYTIDLVQAPQATAVPQQTEMDVGAPVESPKRQKKRRRGAAYRRKMSKSCYEARQRAVQYHAIHGESLTDAVRRSVLQLAQNSAEMTWAQACGVANLYGCSTAIATKALNNLRRQRLLTRIDRGVYKVTEQGLKAA